MTNEATESVMVFFAGCLMAVLSKVAIGAEWVDMIVFAFVGGVVAAIGKEVAARWVIPKIFKHNGKSDSHH